MTRVKSTEPSGPTDRRSLPARMGNTQSSIPSSSALLFAALLLSLVLLSACGSRNGSSDEPTPAGTPLPGHATALPGPPETPPATTEATRRPPPTSPVVRSEPEPTSTSAPIETESAEGSERIEAETPEVAVQIEVLDALNVRGGPGTEFPIVGLAATGDIFTTSGQSDDGLWWRIEFGGEEGWLFAEFVEPIEGQVAQSAPTVTPRPRATATPSGAVDLAPAPAPIGTVVVYEEQVTLPTYPIEPFLTSQRDPTFNWPYQRFDVEEFERANVRPEPREYKVLVLENAYLRLSILPELGGRIWRVIHKPSGANMFYQNSVVKPSPWGPANQKGWYALGGLEWNLPVAEHGYDWGTFWGHLPLQHSQDLAAVTLFTPQDGRFLNASVTISLRSGAASFEVEPTITNVSSNAVDFSFWSTAQLAPGVGNRPSAETRFVLPSDRVLVHDSPDPRLPDRGTEIPWPVSGQFALDRLGNWNEYAGFFESPQAAGPFAGLYDPASQAGAVRISPTNIVRGSKVWAPGWNRALSSALFTEDESSYVELQAGLAPDYDEQVRLPPGGAVTWRTIWYPVSSIGGLTYANEIAAIHLQRISGGFRVGFYPTRPMDGTLLLLDEGREIGRQPVEARPDAPFLGDIPTTAPSGNRIQISFVDSAERPFFAATITAEGQ